MEKRPTTLEREEKETNNGEPRKVYPRTGTWSARRQERRRVDAGADARIAARAESGLGSVDGARTFDAVGTLRCRRQPRCGRAGHAYGRWGTDAPGFRGDGQACG